MRKKKKARLKDKIQRNEPAILAEDIEMSSNSTQRQDLRVAEKNITAMKKVSSPMPTDSPFKKVNKDVLESRDPGFIDSFQENQEYTPSCSRDLSIIGLRHDIYEHNCHNEVESSSENNSKTTAQHDGGEKDQPENKPNFAVKFFND